MSWEYTADFFNASLSRFQLVTADCMQISSKKSINWEQVCKLNATATQLLRASLLNCVLSFQLGPCAGSKYAGNYWRLYLPFSLSRLPFHSFHAFLLLISSPFRHLHKVSFDPYLILCPLNYSSALSHVSAPVASLLLNSIDGTHSSSHPLTS